MQNLANITSTESIVVGSAMLVLCAAPTVLAWSDARRRRKAVAAAAARERALAEAAAHERELVEVAARQAEVAALWPAGMTPTPGLVDLQQLWDEPTVTVDADILGTSPAPPPAAAVFEVPADPPATPTLDAPPIVASVDPPPVAEVMAPPPVAEVIQPEPIAAAAATPAAALPETPPPADAPRFEFCLQELRRVRLPNWPPADVQGDPERSAVWHEGERLAVQHQREIGIAALVSPHRAQSSCLGSAEAVAAGIRLRFFLFPILWPSTEEQATAEAVFEIDRADGTIRSSVNNLRR